MRGLGRGAFRRRGARGPHLMAGASLMGTNLPGKVPEAAPGPILLGVTAALTTQAALASLRFLV